MTDIQREINDRWTSLDTLSLESNTYAALNIRTKLNLLGLDYEEKGETTNKVIDKTTYFKKYLKINTKAYKLLDEYIALNQKNALIAQEHARWNAFHLINDFVPMKIKDIELIKKDGNIKFKTKDLIIKEHSCLTSYKGLKELSLYLLNECNSNDKKKHNALIIVVKSY